MRNRQAGASSGSSFSPVTIPGASASHLGTLGESEDEPPVCPDEDSALVERIRPLQHVQPTPALGEAAFWRHAAKALEVDDPDGGWCGSVATERSDGPRPPLTGPRTLLGGTSSSGDPQGHADGSQGMRLQVARQHVRTALQALASCDLQLRSHMEEQRRRDADIQARKEVATLSAELAEVRAEASQFRRELHRLRGIPEELASLPTGVLHNLQQDLSTSLRNVHAELETRTKCCVCREVERQVLLRPCQHLALCSGCARRVDRCPLCRRGIDRYEVVCVA